MTTRANETRKAINFSSGYTEYPAFWAWVSDKQQDFASEGAARGAYHKAKNNALKRGQAKAKAHAEELAEATATISESEGLGFKEAEAEADRRERAFDEAQCRIAENAPYPYNV